VSGNRVKHLSRSVTARIARNEGACSGEYEGDQTRIISLFAIQAAYSPIMRKAYPYAALATSRWKPGITQRLMREVYERENGWMINALAQLYAATGDASTLAEAEHSARWVTTHRGFAGGDLRIGSNFRFILPAKGRRFRHNDQKIAGHAHER
jgi:hypothetical protein